MRKLNITVLGKTYEVLVEDLGTVNAETLAAAQAEKKPSVPIDTVERSVRVTAPMAGVILEVPVSQGVSVMRGDTLCTLEAMTMHNIIPSPVDGIIRAVKVGVGDSVAEGDLLFIIE